MFQELRKPARSWQLGWSELLASVMPSAEFSGPGFRMHSPGGGHSLRCLLLQVGLFWMLPGITSVTILTVLSFIILMCYGGGFGTMPAFAADYFGSKNVGPIYGLMLTAWGFASAFGPLLIAHMRQTSGSYTSGLHVIACIMAVSMILPILISPPRSIKAIDTGWRRGVSAANLK